MDNLPLPFNAYCTTLLFVNSLQLAYARYATKQSAYDTHFFLDILRVVCYRSVVFGKGYVTFLTDYDTWKKYKHYIGKLR